MGIIATFKEYIEDGIKDVIYDFTNDNKCSCCGNCCNNALPMSKKEIEQIRKYIKANNIPERKNLTPLARSPIDMTCPFRNNTEEVCTIYEVRPKVCRTFICNEPVKSKENREKYANTMCIVDARREFFRK